MLAEIKEYWEIASAIMTPVILGALWLGKLSRDVAENRTQIKELQEQDPCMTILSCGKQSMNCQNYQTTEFEEIKELIKTSHQANQEFIKGVHQTSKELIRDSNKRNDDQHKMVMSHLLNGSAKALGNMKN